MTENNETQRIVLEDGSHPEKEARPFRITFEQDDLLKKHLRAVLKANQHTNLTSITDWDRSLLLHIEDSLAGLTELSMIPQGQCADLGSGGGFPGIPLAIVSGREFVLVESIQKKARILKEVVASLGLEQRIHVAPLRAEELASKQDFRFVAITARALAPLPVLMELAYPLLCEEGSLIAYKAELAQEEIERAQALAALLGMEVHGIREFLLSDGLTKRSIVSISKTGISQITLPRRTGLAQKRPLA